jgi:hypothetical protein
VVEVTPAEVLAAAADKLDALLVETSPGPWFCNGYSYVGSAPKGAAYDAWDPGGDHSLERTGLCGSCGDWREAAACHNWPRGHGCRYFDQDYDMDPEVVSVRSHHGDTAVRSRLADAEYIAAMNPLVGKALAKLLRVEAELATASGPGWAVDESVALARLIVGGES